MDKKVIFINYNDALPTYDSAYEGWFVLEGNNRLYVGTSDGWKELTNDEIITEDISTASESSTGLATAYDVKEYVRTQIAGAQSSYEMVLNDDGSLQCVKNGTDDGFNLNTDGSLELA